MLESVGAETREKRAYIVGNSRLLLIPPLFPVNGYVVRARRKSKEKGKMTAVGGRSERSIPGEWKNQRIPSRRMASM